MIPFLDVRGLHDPIRDELKETFQRVMQSGRFILGEELQSFESEFAGYCECKHCAGVGNGLDAIQLALRAMGVEPGDEVIVPAHTFIATWMGVSNIGAVPVPVDVRSDDYLIDVEQVEAKITSRTRVIMPVHLYGRPANMKRLRELANHYQIKILEDAAQAHGARYLGSRVGSLGDAAIFSFYPGKNLGALGDGGAITSSDPDLIERVKVSRNYGSREKYYHETIGANSRLDELQAAILRVKLKYLDDWNASRVRIAEQYRSELNSGIIVPPGESSEIEPVWHLYTIRSKVRDRVIRALASQKIEAGIHYPIPPFLSGCYPDYAGQSGHYPITSLLANELLSLPMSPNQSVSDTRLVTSVVNEIHEIAV